MKTNERIALVLGAVLLAAGVLAAASALRRGDVPPEDAIPPRPEDTSLELWICDDASNFDWSGHEEVSGVMGGREIFGSGYSPEDKARVLYTLTAWPDFADGGSFVTRISITDPDITVYGLTVNASFQAFEEVFASMGFKVEPAEDAPERIKATRSGITFTLSAGETPELKILAEVTNRQGIVF